MRTLEVELGFGIEISVVVVDLGFGIEIAAAVERTRTTSSAMKKTTRSRDHKRKLTKHRININKCVRT